MTCFSVLEVTPTSQDWIPAYLPATGALVAKHGGTYVARTADHERLEGDGPAVALRIIIQWPTKDAAKAFMADPDYAEHLAARTAGSASSHVLIEATDDLAG